MNVMVDELTSAPEDGAPDPNEEPEVDDDRVLEDARPDRPTGDGGDAASPFARWRSQLPTMVVVVLAVLVAGAAFALWNRNQDLTSDRDDRREASQVASEFTTAVMSYDYQDLQGSLDEVEALSTPEWAAAYEDSWFEDLQPTIQATQAVADVHVDEVLLGDESHGVLPAVVTFNARIVSQIGTRTLEGSYLRVELKRVDGEWLVNDMSFLANTRQNLEPATGAGGEGGDTSTAPPTTAP